MVTGKSACIASQPAEPPAERKRTRSDEGPLEFTLAESPERDRDKDRGGADSETQGVGPSWQTLEENRFIEEGHKMELTSPVSGLMTALTRTLSLVYVWLVQVCVGFLDCHCLGSLWLETC